MSCSITISIPSEQIDSDLNQELITSILLPSSIAGYYLEEFELIAFDSNFAVYNVSNNTISGKGIDGQLITMNIDSLYAIKMKQIDILNGVNLTPTQFKAEIKKSPSKKYNPCWDNVIFKKKSVTINTKKKVITGTSIKGKSINIPLSKVYEVQMKQRSIYKTVKIIFTGVGGYLLLDELKEF